MFDYINADKKWLPQEIQYIEDVECGWQTKSLECNLDDFYIMENGDLIVRTEDKETKSEIYTLQAYTGEIHFYQYVHDKWYDLKARCVNGKVKEVILISAT